MVSVGSISLGVSLKGVKQAIKEAEEFKQEIAGVEDETGVAAGEMDNFSDSTEQGRESTGKMTGAISRLHGWIQILLGGSLVTMITSLVSLSSISAAASVVMAKLTGAFAALVAAGEVVLGAIGTIIGVLSAKIIIILAVIAAVGLLITEITGLTNVTALNKDKVLEFAGAVKQWIINAINSIGKFGKKAFNKLVSLGSKIKNKIINIIDNTIDNIQKKITNLVDKIMNLRERAKDVVTGLTEKLPDLNITSEVQAKTNTERSESNNGDNISQDVTNEINITIDTDQDLSDLSRRDMRQLADEIADRLGDDFNRSI